ncbi:hypothetical protein Taro_036799 [Colocasia esculenta]|uniref:Uncharacterized protein n=1 Tax=Colocasia esculenta TaxID=4460 RepID=A0A843WHD1_COLES|nr:hypothetical protein [Colocasia esculenta]
MAVLPKARQNPCASGAAAALRERNLSAGPEIFESGPGPTGSECRFGIGASRTEPSGRLDGDLRQPRRADWGRRPSRAAARSRKRCGKKMRVRQNPCASGAAAALRKRNPGAGSEISESGPGPTGSECRFGTGVSRAVPITGRGNIHARRNPCASGAAAALRERNLGAGPEISDSGQGPTGSECRFGIGPSRTVPITGRGNIHVLPK